MSKKTAIKLKLTSKHWMIFIVIFLDVRGSWSCSNLRFSKRLTASNIHTCKRTYCEKGFVYMAKSQSDRRLVCWNAQTLHQSDWPSCSIILSPKPKDHRYFPHANRKELENRVEFKIFEIITISVSPSNSGKYCPDSLSAGFAMTWRRLWKNQGCQYHCWTDCWTLGRTITATWICDI